MRAFHPRGTRWIVFFAVLLAQWEAALAEPLPWTLDHYLHTAFTKKDGGPQSVMNVARTSDGMLWTDDVKGLMQFDGHHFTPFVPLPGEALPSTQIHSLFAPTSGGLWVSLDNGVSFIDQGHVVNYALNGGWVGRTADFFQDRQGALWAYAYPGLMKFAAGAWRRVDPQPPDRDINSLRQDPCFNLWATTTEGRVLVLREGAADWVDTGVDMRGGAGIWPTVGHHVFVVASSHVLRHFVDGAGGLVEVGKPMPYYAQSVLVDKGSHVWIGTPDDGIHFLGTLATLAANGGAPLQDEKMNRAGGLTGNYASIFLDREDNIWAGTEAGLDRFSPSPFSQLPLPTGITMVSIAPTGEGDAWIGSENIPVQHFERGVMKPTAVPWTAMATGSGSKGSVFAATADELWRLAPGAPQALAKLPVAGIGKVTALVVPADEAPWLAFRDRASGMARFNDGRWQVRRDLGRPLSLHTDAAGAMWAGYKDNDLALVGATGARHFTAKDGVDVGAVKVIADGKGALWLGGERHLQLFYRGAFTTLTLAGGRELGDISGVLFDRRGNLWVHTLSALFRIAGADVERALAEPHRALPYRLFDADDGVPGIPAQVYTLPTLTMGGDGRLWITGQTAAAWLDPDALPPPPRLGRPIIERLGDGAVSFDLAVSPLRLPKEARSIRIDYTAVEIQFPARVRFQYRLIGFDSVWQDARDLRLASYPRLSAGSYAFEVRAAYEGQPWTDAPASLSFSIAPKYFETWWFRAVAVALMLAALWAAIRWQINQEASRERRRMQIRLDERETIARDLHDTLLQSTQALVIQLHVAARAMDACPLQLRLDQLAQESQDAIVEARDKVQALRAHALSHVDFVEKLRRLGDALAARHGIDFTAEVKGAPRPLDPHAAEQLLPIVSELLINAFRHAQAREVSVQFRFGRWRFGVSVVDDGIGLLRTIWTAGAPTGHWGLKGVRERAARIGARVALASGRQRGTRLRVTLSSLRAYS